MDSRLYHYNFYVLFQLVVVEVVVALEPSVFSAVIVVVLVVYLSKAYSCFFIIFFLLAVIRSRPGQTNDILNGRVNEKISEN